MARFLVKASEFKNVCKAVNDRKLAELKKEIIEILKKQDEKEVKKATDYFESQELHYTHLEKSFNGKWVEKAGYGVGTVRIWKGKKYKKIAPGKWARVFEKEGRGTNIAIGKLIAKVQKIDNVEDLMAFVMANKQRFVDENGVDLPVLDKLRTAVDARNGNVGSKENSKTAEKYDARAYEEEKNNVLRHTNKDYDSVDAALKDMYAHKNWIDRKPSDETEHEKTVRESRLKAVDDIIEGLKNGDKKLLDKFVKDSNPAEKKTKTQEDYEKEYEQSLKGKDDAETLDNIVEAYDKVAKKLRPEAKEKGMNPNELNDPELEALGKLRLIYSEKNISEGEKKYREELEKLSGRMKDAINNEFGYEEESEDEKKTETKEVPFGGVDKDDEGEGVEALSMADKINEVAEKGQLKVGNTTYKVDKDGKEWAVRTEIMNAIKCKEGIDKINDEFEKKAKPMLEAELKQRLDRIKEKLPEIVKEGKLEENKKLVEERLKRYSEGAGEGLTVDAVISNHKKDVINKLENHVKDNELFTQKNTDEIELLGNVDHQVELCSIDTSAVFYAECKKLLDEYSEEESEAENYQNRLDAVKMTKEELKKYVMDKANEYYKNNEAALTKKANEAVEKMTAAECNKETQLTDKNSLGMFVDKFNESGKTPTDKELQELAYNVVLSRVAAAQWGDKNRKELDEQNEAEQKQKEEAVNQKEKEIKEKYHGYFDSRSGLDKARDLKTLEKKYNFDGKVMSSKEFVEQAMDNGVEIKEREVNKLDYPSRTRWNRMNGYEQDEYEKRIKAAGKKTVYSINGFEFPKTVVDYAKFYKENGKSKTGSEKPSKSEIAIKNKATSLAGAFGYSKTYATKMGSPFNLELAEQTVDEELDWDDGSKKALKEELRRIYSEKKVQKSLFDDFVMDMLVDEDEEDFEVRKIDESLWNDYSAEQPELFNSTELMVREAFNRCRVL